VLEAMACGLPVLLTPGCNFPEVMEAGAGLVIAREIGPLAEALRALLTDAERRASMGQRARALVLSRYTWPQVVAQMEQVYRMVIERRNSELHE
jgi:glycosyltransferase involved in cell wall biosynthesis